ncbi:Hypothetical predicted protein [Pelobates cultripes]|uniref:Uncharacterized protein n=1 Tax=Pelobates cultripes TaxID=61616 RepID=A0AAD1WUD0_PELCU|nr:Hypothetical predicted protein [Pelobates cultripes]
MDAVGERTIPTSLRSCPALAVAAFRAPGMWDTWLRYNLGETQNFRPATYKNTPVRDLGTEGETFNWVATGHCMRIQDAL